ncbi:molybdenum ABC transporter ATP-binding protein [Vespertiliibacter pulmonis]|uniref:Molybdate transport system ATP-binding protein n=1 Tax=Vespertiliibacter pulmonis TaxID=1443036 RepID=A0A3N4W4X5_9PAST|nr:molybdenum ABC transporter ATP-binding protein ModC [Vespertiliibacter pulmonis]QLB20252.1 molybdenum ABC transporter ATP-binding protein [Vespertiliibacter pulmonis]RPE86231.1 molybdate transport system ATP-binding protein [Vespertiliibacter pulmonis]
MLQISVKQQLGQLNLDVNVAIESQGVTAIFGRSGAGKSSLINLIAGLSKAESGQIVLNQRVLFSTKQKINLPPEKRRIGYVFQEPRLFPHYRVEGNLKYGCKRPDPEKFLQLVELLGLGNLLNRYPNSLSGGEKQRVAIGRALLSEPELLLMDEPLSALDIPKKNELLSYLRQLAQKLQIPILYVTHSLGEVIRLSNRLLLLEQGKMMAYASTTEVLNSELFLPWQIESKNSLLELSLRNEQPQDQMLALQLGKQSIWINRQSGYEFGDKIRIMIASRDVSITLEQPVKTSIRNILKGTIYKIETRPDRLDIAITVGEQIIWATISSWAFSELQLTVGQLVYLQIKSISI